MSEQPRIAMVKQSMQSGEIIGTALDCIVMTRSKQTRLNNKLRDSGAGFRWVERANVNIAAKETESRA